MKKKKDKKEKNAEINVARGGPVAKKFSKLSTILMATVILSSPFMVPMMESADFEGEDTTFLSEKINLIGKEHKPTSYAVSSSTPQFVLLSFDGSKSISMLRETLDFQNEMEAERKPVKFTYYVNSAYFLTEENAQIYHPPRAPAGSSNIGFSNSAKDIAERVSLFNRAFDEGNEIGSHAVGHFNGYRWTEAEWKKEFDSWKGILYNVSAYTKGVDVPKPKFLKDVIGFRAPDLGVNEDLYQTLKDFNFVYDTSGVGAPDLWPMKDALGIWHIPLGVIEIGPRKLPTLSMDYSIWILQSGGKDDVRKGTPEWDRQYKEVLEAFMKYFNDNYNGGRAPVVVANHFTKMNDGVYWEAMKDFAREVCGKPYVRCSTYKTFVNYLNVYGVPEVVN